jgi:hypothetical protein
MNPYAWVIEYFVGPQREIHCCFIKNDGSHDLAYVMQRAADLHGEVFVLDRRERDAA